MAITCCGCAVNVSLCLEFLLTRAGRWGLKYMKNRLAAVIAAAAFSAAPAFAADLPMKAPAMKAPLAAVYDWTGFYFGVNAGVGIGRDLTQWSLGPFTPTSYLTPFGAIGGAQMGYNWQAGNWVFGLEADIQGAGLRDDRTCTFFCTSAGLFASFDQKLDWFGTARGRVGLATGPVLSYFTGGFAYGGVKTSVTDDIGALPGSASISETRTGWTFGSGVEAALGGNWTGKIEYLYLDLGTQSGVYTTGGATRTFSSDIRENIFRVGLNYRIGGKPAYAAVAAANWSGFYAGGNFGGGTARNLASVTVIDDLGNVNGAETFNLSPAGYLGGGQIGYNWQATNWVLGFEVDFQGTSLKDDKSCQFACAISAPQFQFIDQRLPWLGTVRGRLGYAAGSSLIYATGGLAYGEVTNRVEETIGAASFKDEFKHTKTGWTVGGGLETPLDLFGWFGRNWTAKTEYLYVDLGKTTDSYSVFVFDHTIETRVQEHIFRTGLNYHFNAVPAPVAARY